MLWRMCVLIFGEELTKEAVEDSKAARLSTNITLEQLKVHNAIQHLKDTRNDEQICQLFQQP